jgi:hypothetical protein
MGNVKEVKVHDERHNKINRLGTRHECIREINSSDMITSHIEKNGEMISFSETAANMPMSCDYVLKKMGDKTKMALLVHLELPFIKMLTFNLFEKKKMSAFVTDLAEKIRQYCEAKAEGSGTNIEKG